MMYDLVVGQGAKGLTILGNIMAVYHPTKIYLFKVNNTSTRKSTLCHWRRSGVFIVNFKHISHLFLSIASFVDEQFCQFLYA